MAGMEGYYSMPEPRAEDEWNVNDEEYYYRRINQNPATKYDREALSRSLMVKPKSSNAESEEEQAYLTTRKFIADGVRIATLITENLLSHPFVVIRRQCQVNHNSRRFHNTPFTLLPVIVRLNQRQGLATLWKGLGSVLLVRGMTLAIEDVISKFTPWPKEVGRLSTFKQWGQHFLLKSVTLAIVTPFYVASLVETVQSDIASEKPGIFDVFREGMCRLFSWSGTQKGRMLPIWSLVLPTVVFGICKYGFSRFLQSGLSGILHLNLRISQENKGALPRDSFNHAAHQDIEITSSMFAVLGTEVVFYPFETILHRIHLQGTRTIIDNLDSGREVIPILTSYEGALDCYTTTVQSEGVCGLYKGFGALVLQCLAHYALIRVTKAVLTQASTFFRSSSPPPPELLKRTITTENLKVNRL
ncbi:mitochondrial outer membrane protein SLC25A46-like [Macrosteles quadrilineatus]|uniref:mitochondrial outer membrane protein SLC25A46-like n=1 Tax=Macrosteles quadrilineatus TaxID=74068 RepID=UPI0023E28CF8|nr:mitochondrial outer membrane protein SLC25A46-like [Macrosteles quadrilineatus]